MVGPEHFNNHSGWSFPPVAPQGTHSDLGLCNTVHMDEQLFVDPLASQSGPRRSPAGLESAGQPVVAGPSTSHADIPLAADRAIEAFSEYPHLWWPANLRSQGAESHLEFIGGELVEEGTDGTAHLWATIAAVEPGELQLEWWGRPGASDANCRVVIRFVSNEGEDRTMVSVELEDAPVSALWEQLLAGFARFTGGALV